MNAASSIWLPAVTRRAPTAIPARRAYFAKKRMIKGTDTAESIFEENEFISETELATSRWQYESIKIIAETNNYFVFVFDMNHAQVYDKKCLSEEKTNEFREFISEKTGLKILEIK